MVNRKRDTMSTRCYHVYMHIGMDIYLYMCVYFYIIKPIQSIVMLYDIRNQYICHKSFNNFNFEYHKLIHMFSAIRILPCIYLLVHTHKHEVDNLNSAHTLIKSSLSKPPAS